MLFPDLPGFLRNRAVSFQVRFRHRHDKSVNVTHSFSPYSQLIIHGIPKRSVHMPNPLAQKVGPNGIVTEPPSDNLLKISSPFTASIPPSESEKPPVSF